MNPPRHCPSCQCKQHDNQNAKTTRRTAEQLLAALPRDPPHVTADRCRELDNALAHTSTEPEPTDRPCPVCEDCEWLIDSNEYHPERLATRIGIHYSSLLRHLKRHHRNDLRTRLDTTQVSTTTLQPAN